MNKDKLRQSLQKTRAASTRSTRSPRPTYFWDWPSRGGGDPEHGQYCGTPVDEERVRQVFSLDIAATLDECQVLYPDFDELPEEAQLIIANMMFNMGRPRLSKFKGMKAGVDAKDWNRAADEMVDSRWYDQVTNAKRLVARMRAIEDTA